MSERAPKRPRQREVQAESVGGGQRYGGGSAGGVGATKLSGCHLEVILTTGHVFLGHPIDVAVHLLDDEDLVQHTTMDINVSVTGENGKVCVQRNQSSLFAVVR